MGGGGGAGGGATNGKLVVDVPAALHATTPAPAPALQVIVLGSGGGPLENNVTAFLVRSLASGWAKSSLVAVDAGVHLSAIAKILEKTQPPNLGQQDGPSLPHKLTEGPFAGLEVHCARADANAAHIHKSLIESYLLTHPHLDHIAGFIINTAGLPGTRPKRVAGLPSTITALKTHIFNNVIWPNLSDENNGAGLVTYTRLVEGGSPALGEGEGRGYLEICDGLAVKIFGVSHGHCIERHSHRGSTSTRHGSFDGSSGGPIGMGPQSILSPSRNSPHPTSIPANLGSFLQQQQERIQASRRGSSLSGGPPPDESVCVYDSSAYFIRDMTTGREVLMFGDVEPDSISLSPRNRRVWQEAAPKIAAGKLTAIFIECSYDDSQCVDRLFGHLTPRFICEEMTALAEEVVAARLAMEDRRKTLASLPPSGNDKKRKRLSHDGSALALAKRRSTPQPSDAPVSPKTLNPDRRVHSFSSPLSDHDYFSKTLPLPTHPHPPRSAPSPALGSQPDHGLVQTQNQDQDTEMTASSSHPSPSAATAMTAPTPLSTITNLPRPLLDPQQQQQQQQQQEPEQPLLNALLGLKVVVIHVKEKMSDGPRAGDVILEELEEHERGVGLGVEFVVSRAGADFFL